MNYNQRRKRYKLIIIVKSSPNNAARRIRLRHHLKNQTVKLKSSVGLLFSLGVPADTGNRSKLLGAISDEANRFDDIILTDFIDSYYNLTLKTYLNIRFAHVACRNASPLFGFMDDDHGINLHALLDYFNTFDREEKHQGQLRHSIFGQIHQRPPVLREPRHKWAVTRSDMPFSMYPDYASGPCYFIGAEAVASLSIATAFTKSFPLEDVYLQQKATWMHPQPPMPMDPYPDERPGIRINCRSDGHLLNIRLMQATMRVSTTTVYDLLFLNVYALNTNTEAGMQRSMEMIATGCANVGLTVCMLYRNTRIDEEVARRISKAS
ncbi:unnamed protein product [Dibothriocephalus latus]|uniref:Hexosyltransferase n=1 Tax=Dibothriocephalus latus TaxID=60516 RepID=A0A3P6TIW7_DIBLA|nr:unnamed protein product [Dibothriocephalus latus]